MTVFGKILNELVKLRTAYEAVNRDKLEHLRLSSTPIVQASRPNYATAKDEEVIFDVDFTKEVKESLEEQERKLWGGNS